MSTNIECPVCEKELSTPQGAHGHMRMAHSLSGKELRRAYRKALPSRSTGAGTSAEAGTEASTERTRQPVNQDQDRPMDQRTDQPESQGRQAQTGEPKPRGKEGQEPAEETGPTSYRVEGPNVDSSAREKASEEAPARPQGGQDAGTREAENRELENRREQRPAVSSPEGSAARVHEALDQVRHAMTRFLIAEELTGEETEVPVDGEAARQERETGGPGMVETNGPISRLFAGSGEKDREAETETETITERTAAEKELLEECREKVEEARQDLHYALERRQIEHDHGRVDVDG